MMPFGLLTRVGPRNDVLDGGPDPHTSRGNFEGEKGPAQDMRRLVWQSVYSKKFSRRQHRYGSDADWGVLDGVHIGATWRIRLNRPCVTVMWSYVRLLRPLC